MAKHKIHPAWFLVIGITILIVPTAIYLGFLIPQMREEYIMLMGSGGVIGGAGMLGASVISEKTKYGKLYKTASTSFSLLVFITLVQEFIHQLIGLAAVAIVSYIIFYIFKELWRNAKRKRENGELAAEIARGIAQTTE